MFFEKYGLFIGGIMTIVGGIITLWYSHVSNLKNEKKTDETLEVSKQTNVEASKANLLLDEANLSLGKLKQENSHLKTQISNLQSENLELHRELSIENKEILDNITGGESFPIIEFHYRTPNGVLEVFGSVEGKNNLIIQEILVTNSSGEAKFRKENQQPLAMNSSPIVHGKWKRGLTDSKFAFLTLSPKRLVPGFKRNLVEKYSMAEFYKTDQKISVEIETITQNRKFIQKTDLFLGIGMRGGGRWDDLLTLKSEVFDEKGNVLYSYENNEPWAKSFKN